MHLSKRKKERELVENYIRHISIVSDSSNFLTDAYNALMDLNYSKLDELTNEIEKKEKDADDVRRENEKLLYEGVLFPSDRFTFITLSENIDHVMGKILQTLRTFSLRNMPLPGVNFLKDVNFKEYVDVTIETLKLLQEAVTVFFTDSQKAIDLCHKIEEYEHRADVIKLKILKELHRREKELDVYTVLQIENLVHRIDEITDEAENTSDTIVLILTVAKP